MANYTIGLDLGSAADYSALVVVERVYILPAYVSLNDWHRRPDEYRRHLVEEKHVRYLSKWELGTPYPSIVADVAGLMRRDWLQRDGLLFVDQTGVGRAVMDMFAEAHREAPLGRWAPIGVTITGGRDAKGWNVPKQDLFASIQAPLQLERLKIAEGMALSDDLEKELTNFRLKIGDSGRESVDYHRRAGDGHGDLVSALALAMYGNNPGGRPDVLEDPKTLVSGGTK